MTPNLTQSFPSLVWAGGNQTFDLGDSAGVQGFEMNVWMLPQRTADDELVIPVMRFLNSIEIKYELLRDPNNVLGNAISMKYNGLTYN